MQHLEKKSLVYEWENATYVMQCLSVYVIEI
jgi:hypothetical protein